VPSQTAHIHRVLLLGILINAGALVAGVFAQASGPAYLNFFALEDGFLEWLQFLSFAVLAVTLACLSVARFRALAPRIEVLALAALSGVVAIAALEEISWFQRVLTIETPSFFQQHNKQNETNIHNLAVGGVSLHKHIMLKAIFIVGILHNLVLPLLALRNARVQAFVESLGLYLPPLKVALCYLALVALSHVVIDHPRKGEFGETFGAVHYLTTVFSAYVMGAGYAKRTVVDAAQAKAVALVFSLGLLFLVFVAWLLAHGYKGT